MNPQRQYAGEGAKADRDDEEHRKDNLVDCARRIHRAAHRLQYPQGAIFSAERMPQGMAQITAKTVPQMAIWKVISISAR